MSAAQRRICMACAGLSGVLSGIIQAHIDDIHPETLADARKALAEYERAVSALREEGRAEQVRQSELRG